MDTNRILEGKTAWVTGSSRGIGRVIAGHLASLGAHVAVHGTSPISSRTFGEAESLAAIAEEVAETSGTRVVSVVGDLTDPAVVKSCADTIREQLGPIDILVNNAGGDVGARGVAAKNAGRPEANNPIDISVEDIRTVLDRNIMTCILCCKEIAPDMRERRTGWIVTIGSTAGFAGRAEGAVYAASKAAVHEYTRCVAALLRPYNVSANVVAPGGTYTPRFAASREIDDAMTVEGGTLLRYAQPIEIARAVEFFLSPQGAFVTGQVLRVDGGNQLWPS